MAGSYPEQVPTSALGICWQQGQQPQGRLAALNVIVLLHREPPEDASQLTDTCLGSRAAESSL